MVASTAGPIQGSEPLRRGVREKRPPPPQGLCFAHQRRQRRQCQRRQCHRRHQTFSTGPSVATVSRGATDGSARAAPLVAAIAATARTAFVTNARRSMIGSSCRRKASPWSAKAQRRRALLVPSQNPFMFRILIETDRSTLEPPKRVRLEIARPVIDSKDCRAQVVHHVPESAGRHFDPFGA